MTDWLILRTSSRATLRLAASLTSEGIVAWSPKLSLPQTKRPVPIVPRYVFARSGHLAELHELMQRRGKHDAFSIIYSFGRPGFIADDELEPFRSAEIGCTAQATKCGFALGRAVRVAEGIAAGKEGLVESSNWRRTKVDFPGERPMEFDTSILREIVPQGREAA